MHLIDSLKDCSNSILGVRDGIGAQLKKICIITRTWTGTEVGEGDAKDKSKDFLPTPHIVDLSLNFRAKESGNVKDGDILLKGASKVSYPDKSEFATQGHGKNVERFFLVGDVLYEMISARERYLTWDIQLRPLSDQKRY